MHTLSIDIETHCSIDLAKAGVYHYVEAPDFEILLFGYSVDGGEVKVVDLACGEKIHRAVIEAISDNTTIKFAFNAQFERICLSRYLGLPTGQYLNPHSWRCTMVWSAYTGLPLSLQGVGSVLGLEKQKLSEGKNLIRYFCIPCAPTKVNGGRTRNYPIHDLEKWNLFKQYNIRDVETEMAIQTKLARFPVPEHIWAEYHLDQEINDRGVLLDMDLVHAAITMDNHSHQKLISTMQRITELENPNSVNQMKQWLADNGLETETLGKKVVTELIKTAPPELQEILSLRQQLAKSSVKKYQAMANASCNDNRARGMFQFYGANRSGRWAGRIIQMQNLVQNHLPDLQQARELVRATDYEAVELLYEDVPDTLSQLIRTAFIPKTGTRFIVADFSAIEARVLAWLAGERWRLEAFAAGEDIYCASASKMFGVPVKKHGVNGHLRQKGKQAELACIAQGQLVLTDTGLVPIEQVTLNQKLWDGENWVCHEGVIAKGENYVITNDGLTATPDHLVWVKGQSQPIQFGIAASYCARLVQTADNTKQLSFKRQNPDSKQYDSLTTMSMAKVYDIQNAGVNHRFTVSGRLVHNCGYGGSVGALKAMGALEMGLGEDDLKPLVDAWRRANPKIVQFWWEVDKAIKDVVKDKKPAKVRNISISYEKGILFIELPSSRRLAYIKPQIGENRFGGESATYEGTGSTKKWERIESYGPKFVENIVQAIARDILAEAMLRLNQLNFNIVMHVHDEVVLEVPDGVSSVQEICAIMSECPIWAKGLLLNADGYECDFYMKD